MEGGALQARKSQHKGGEGAEGVSEDQPWTRVGTDHIGAWQAPVRALALTLRGMGEDRLPPGAQPGCRLRRDCGEGDLCVQAHVGAVGQRVWAKARVECAHLPAHELARACESKCARARVRGPAHICV